MFSFGQPKYQVKKGANENELRVREAELLEQKENQKVQKELSEQQQQMHVTLKQQQQQFMLQMQQQ